MKPEPEDSYGIAKLAVEKELEISHRMFGLDYTIFRPHNVYGDRQNIGDKYRNVVGIFMNQLMKGEPMTIYGDGEQQRAFTHVSDVVPIIAESVTNKHAANQVFNVGSHEVTSVNYLSKIIADRMGYFHSVTHLPPRMKPRSHSPTTQGGRGIRRALQDAAERRHRQHGAMGQAARRTREQGIREYRNQ
jgi:UDP-glucose 4-epimerase